MNKQQQKDSFPPLVVKAEMALRKAVADVIEAHRRSGEPLAIWQDGRVVWLPPDQVAARASHDQCSHSEVEGETSCGS